MTAENGPRLPGFPATPAGSRVLGVGLDLVHVIGIAEQLAAPGTVFAERVFSARERREARRRSAATGSDEAEHLAARWAAKEAFVKAWSQALGARAGRPVAPVVGSDDVDWREVEVVTDRWGRPFLRVSGVLAREVETSLGRGASGPERWPVSLTHDGGWAAAVVLATEVVSL